MDNIEITVFDEINDYKEKIYFFNFRQWIFAIIIVGLVVPTYILLKDRIGDEITSDIVIAIAGVFGFIGFIYLVIAVFGIACLLKKNDFGYPQFGNKTLLVIDEDNKETGLKKGDLLILDYHINQLNFHKKLLLFLRLPYLQLNQLLDFRLRQYI